MSTAGREIAWATLTGAAMPVTVIGVAASSSAYAGSANIVRLRAAAAAIVRLMVSVLCKVFCALCADAFQRAKREIPRSSRAQARVLFSTSLGKGRRTK